MEYEGFTTYVGKIDIVFIKSKESTFHIIQNNDVENTDVEGKGEYYVLSCGEHYKV